MNSASLFSESSLRRENSSYSAIGSSALVGSSKMRIGAFLYIALAKANFCPSPPENSIPSLSSVFEMEVSIPFGRLSIFLSLPLFFRHNDSFSSSKGASKTTFSFTEYANR